MIEILSICVLVAFWLSMFIQTFSIGSNKRALLKWGGLCLLIGFLILFLGAPTGVFEMPISVGAFVTLFFVSSLGSGYFVGLAIQWLHHKKCVGGNNE